MKIELIEKDTFDGTYGFPFVAAIIEHPEYGRLYITQAYGGEDSLSGGAYRWRHGFAVRIGDEDTFANLKEREYNEHYTCFDALQAAEYGDIIEGLDAPRLAATVGLS